MVKAADALSHAGYDVRVVSMSTFEWGASADRDIVARRSNAWRWQPIEYRRGEDSIRYLRAASRQRVSMAIAGMVGVANAPSQVVSRASERGYLELRDAAADEGADLVYGGGRSLSAASHAAARVGARFALDLEDFHSGEVDPDNPAIEKGDLIHSLWSRVERASLEKAAFLTGGSDAISEAYEALYGIRPSTINNVFRVTDSPPSVDKSGPLRLYWFSQMVTGRRGIEDAVRAAGIAGIDVSLTLRGRADSGYVVELRRLAARVAPNLKLDVIDPVFPDDLVDASREFDVGLALEQRTSRNNDLALSNKAFTYMAAGLAVAFTDTAGQRALAHSLGNGAVVYDPGNAEALASYLKGWSDDPGMLAAAKRTAWNAARTRWRWDHEAESGKLLALVAAAL